MTRTADQRIPQASLREEWSVSSVQRLAWAMGRPPAAPIEPMVRGLATDVPTPLAGEAGQVPDPVRWARRIEALRRLAADPRATPAERALAAQRLAATTSASFPTAC